MIARPSYLFLFTVAAVEAFRTGPSTSTCSSTGNCLAISHVRSTRRFGTADDNDEEEENSSSPYGSRSLSWTNHYRKLLPYEHARRAAMSLGLRCKQDWDDYLLDGKHAFGPYMPNRPDEMYMEDWESWDEFLGVMRSYDDARWMVQNVLRLDNMDDYRAFVKSDTKRAEGLRIPAQPEKVYQDKGWISDSHFFGKHGDAEP